MTEFHAAPLSSVSAPTGRPVTAPAPPARSGPLWLAAQELEATFLAEMLKSAGLGETPEVFGGGAGEDQFASFLRDAQARAMVEAGGLGLAETLYLSLQKEMRQ